MNWKPGDAGMYHYQGATARFTEGGSWVQNAGPMKGLHSWTVGDASWTIEDGKITADVNGTKVVIKDQKILFGDESASIALLTEDGPSQLLFTTK